MSDQITSAVLQNDITKITVLSMGCSIQDWQVNGRHVVLGYSDPEMYRSNPCVLGSIVGRIANRTAGAAFEFDNALWTLPANEGPNHIHGGPGGLAWRNWDLVQHDDTSATLTLHSAHLDQGYPGAVDFSVHLTLRGGALTWDMTGTPDRETPLNLAQHVYFNLAGAGDVLNHSVQIDAEKVTPTDVDLIPTGQFLETKNSRFDFQKPIRIAKQDPENRGYDLNFVLNKSSDPQAIVTSPDGTKLRLWTDQPGLQFYSSQHLTPLGAKNAGASHHPNCGFCVEAQKFPNAINQPAFGSILCTPDSPYRQTTTIEIQESSRNNP